VSIKKAKKKWEGERTK